MGLTEITLRVPDVSSEDNFCGKWFRDHFRVSFFMADAFNLLFQGKRGWVLRFIWSYFSQCCFK